MMKCLTVHQPFAWKIVTGSKTCENRTWRAAYRGLVLIHAGKARPLVDCPSLPLGAIIGSVHLADVISPSVARKRGLSDVSGPVCWQLADAIAFAHPLPCKGQCGLWALPSDLEPVVAVLLQGEGLERPATRVCNVRTAALGSYVYVGRAVRGRFPGSVWGNPFRVGQDGDLVEVLARYRLHVLSRKDLLQRLPELKGKTLGCWCCDGNATTPLPKVCHAQILAELVDSLPIPGDMK